MTQKSLLHAVAAQIANGYETAEVPMYLSLIHILDDTSIWNGASTFCSGAGIYSRMVSNSGRCV